MAFTIFNEGTPVKINEVLLNKDKRVEQQNLLMKEDPTATIIATKLNIPGPIKNNHYLEEIFLTGIKELKSLIGDKLIKNEIIWQLKTGPEAFWVTDIPIKRAKEIAISFEDAFTLGRLFDVDVLSLKTKEVPLSRRDLGFEPRKCLICSRPAKECARSRKHSVLELQEKISQMDRSYFNYAD
ncbi:citrate lyase holo-[acyl-carrier protein] synthase [Xylocopilactobacillus apis]|uniref:citrate lyase holo-[acyl-carrier protein] synthase n=1 Tax=Xylocopilactobacillus apis TaxID=2932183 RepID=A0AAU9CPN1_9LACO|nr:citrate lyase holo-[acyl-carrier protein] synthase [Xylocopilactobacillus apis]BDR55912.1 holo-ACP synthase CitX [Xylocopilactobacillus apis]